MSESHLIKHKKNENHHWFGSISDGCSQAMCIIMWTADSLKSSLKLQKKTPKNSIYYCISQHDMETTGLQ